ncbi:ankyrin repeat-containing domain protein [Aspergillus insuetus]
MDPSPIVTTLAPVLELNANILENLQSAIDNVESEKDKENLNNLYLAADHLSDLTIFVFTNLSVNQQALKDADISAETVDLVTGFLGGLSSLIRDILEFSHVLCGRADGNDSDDDGMVTLEFIQENPDMIVGTREGIERCSKALDVILCLTQVWLDLAYKANPCVLGHSLAALHESISTLNKENSSFSPDPDKPAAAAPLSFRLFTVAQAVYSSILTAHPLAAMTTSATKTTMTTTPAPTTGAISLKSGARNLFHTYVSMSDYDEVKALLDVDAGLLARAPGPQGLYPVHYAAYGGHLEILRLLVRYGAQAWAAAGANGETPLMLAAVAGNLEVVKFLINMEKGEGADVDVEVDVDIMSDAHGATALLCVCDHGHLEVARFLAVEKKADPFLADKEGCSPLMKAVNAGHRVVVEMLFEEIDLEEWAGSIDERQRDLATARAFLEKGADSSIVPGKEKTPVQAAIGRGFDGVAEYLLSEAMKLTNVEYMDSDSDESEE